MWYSPRDLDTQSPSARGRGRSPSLAALLSFLWPGLGHLYLRKRRIAALFALPAILLTLLLAYQLRQGVVVFAARFADPSFSRAALALVLLAGVLRLVAVGHSFLGGDWHTTRRVVERAIVVALAATIIVSHSAAGYLLLVTSDAFAPAFDPNAQSNLIDQSTPGPSLAPGQTATPFVAVPTATAPPEGHRVTILFTGVDSDPQRTEHLYDSIMVVSYDPKTNSVQMVSVPRDSAAFPLYYGGQVKVTVRINSLPTYVKNGWVISPDDPYTTLVKEVGYLVGIPINYHAVMDLDGFVQMIDRVGGIDVNNPDVIDDPSYDWLNGGPIGFYLAAGPQHLDGKHALAYVRSRHGDNNSDWARAGRQQEVLVDLLHKIAQPSQIVALPGLIRILGQSVNTDFPADKVADFVAIGQDIPKGNFKQVVLGPPYTVTNINYINSAATTCLLNDKVAALSIQLFGTDSTWYGKPAPADTCYTQP